ncbi:mRNA splicing factor [Geranomyces variabilis]|nr:mRNA splicing factor [Geranomyces variabilis]KAJ3138340.1 Coiled-coil domain-containing protein 12 [Geranomyces variabilis]
MDLQAETQRRKDRLAALRAARAAASQRNQQDVSNDQPATATTTTTSIDIPRLRPNRDTSSVSDTDQQIRPPPIRQTDDDEDSSSTTANGKPSAPTLETAANEIAAAAAAAAAAPQPAAAVIAMTDLAPRKPNFDLARDLAAKMERLDKRTAGCIAELIRERLKGEGDVAVLAIADMDVQTSAQDANADDD